MPETKLDWPELLDDALTLEGRVGDVYSRFYEYSFLNRMLLRMQGVNEPVATCKHWQKLERQVVRGAQARSILRPIFSKSRAAAEKVGGDQEASARLVGFKLVKCLFPLSETTGKELPPAPELPGWDLEAAKAELGIREVPFESLSGNTQGYSIGLEYATNPLAVNRNRTTFHELGHIVLGHTLPSQHADYLNHRGVKEFEAEATSYLTMHELGQLDEASATHSRGYIQGWLLGEKPSDESIRSVFKATDAILRAGRPVVTYADIEDF